MTLADPIILVDPLPRTLDLIMEPDVRARLDRLGRLVISEDVPMSDAIVEQHLPETVLILGQTALPRERLDRAPKLKGVINVETNLLPNIDYLRCQERGIWVLTPAGALRLGCGGGRARHGARSRAGHHVG